MDLRRLRSGEILTCAGALGLSAVLFMDWFGGRSGWSTMTVGRVLLVLTILLAMTLVVVTLGARAVSMATSAATVTIGVGSLALILLLYRVGLDEPGRNAPSASTPALTSGCPACSRSSPGRGARSATSARAARSRCARPSACSACAVPRGRPRRRATQGAAVGATEVRGAWTARRTASMRVDRRIAPAGSCQCMSYTIKTLTESEDMAPKFGLASMGESRFASEDLATEETGVAHYRLLPGKRQPFGHRHEQAEEVYVVLSGAGRVKLDDEIAQIGRLDAIRVAPP